MKRSILPAFIKRRSVGNIKDVTSGLKFLKDDGRSIHSGKALVKQQRFFQKNCSALYLDVDSVESTNDSLVIENSNSQPGSPFNIQLDNNEFFNASFRRHSSYDVSFASKVNIIVSNRSSVIHDTKGIEGQMVDQEDIIALTKHVRSFSDSLNNLRNTFKESTPNGVYNEIECKSVAHNRLSEVLKILKEILGKYPPLHSTDILTAASSIIKKIKTYNYADGKDGPSEYYAAIDLLALSFSSSVHDFLLGDKEMASPNSPGSALDQDEDGSMDQEEDYDPKFFQGEDDEKNESEDSLDQSNHNAYDLDKVDNDDVPSSPTILPHKVSNIKDITIQRTDQLDKTLLSIEGSVEIALQRTKVWAKYAKDILTYFERRSHLEAECSKQIANLAHKTRASIVEESYLPFQSSFVTALENDITFANNYSKSCQTTLQNIVDKLTSRMKDHDAKRAKLKGRWKNEFKKLNESRESLRAAKKLYIQKQKDLEKFNKQQSEGKDEKGGFSIGKKKGQEDFQKVAEESEQQYRHCVEDANFRQQELERIKSESLIELRQLVYQCDTTMKTITIEYLEMMHSLYMKLPVQYRTLADSCTNYEEGQQFADFVKLQQSTSNQAMCPTYIFESYRGEGNEKLNASIRQGNDGNLLAISSEDYLSSTPGHPRRSSVNSNEQNERPKQAWGSLPRNKGSATDDTDSLSSRSLPGSPQISPPPSRKSKEPEICSDDENTFKEVIPKGQKIAAKNQKLTAAAKTHKFRRLRTAAKCKECDSYVYFNGNECEKCGLICHKKCLEKLAIKCGNKRQPRKMTTFGVDFHQHLAATKRKDIPYIIEKCIETIDDNGLSVKGLYRVSGVKSKVEKLCQQFETDGDLVDLSNAPPHFVASVLKLYLRQLPEPLLTFKLYQSFIDIAKDSMILNVKTTADIKEMNDTDADLYEKIIARLHKTVKSLPSANFYTTAKLIKHLKRVDDNSEENHMSSANIAIVFGPTLLRPEGNPNSLSTVMDMPHQTRAVELLILNSQIFSVIEEADINESGYKPSTQGKKRIETVHESPGERDESNMGVCRDFTKEVLYIVEASQKQKDEEKTVVDPQTVLPGQTINDYDNLRDDFETDAVGNLPVLPNKSTPSIISQHSVSSGITDYDSALSRLSSIDSLPSDVVSFDLQSPVDLPDSSRVPSEEQDDDLWMNQFGKEPLKKALSSSAVETVPVSASTFGLPVKKKKISSNSRIETTTYSFSIGNNISKNQINEDDGDTIAALAASVDDNNADIKPSSWLKQRDSKDRVPVRKHLKQVNVETTRSLADDQQPHTPTANRRKISDALLNGSGVGTQLNNNNRNTPPSPTLDELSVNINIARQQLDAANTEYELSISAPKSSRQGPTVLPKPKKPLDKKSWTANLIKSKTQKIPEHPQYGSLNQKLLHSNNSDGSCKSNLDQQNIGPRTSSLREKPSVKEIREKFQNAEEKYV